MAWVRAVMTADEQAGQYGALQDEFASAFIKARAPADAALFVATAPGSDPYFYLSPAGAALLSSVLAGRPVEICDPPKANYVTRLIGSAPPGLSLDTADTANSWTFAKVVHAQCIPGLTTLPAGVSALMFDKPLEHRPLPHIEKTIRQAEPEV